MRLPPDTRTPHLRQVPPASQPSEVSDQTPLKRSTPALSVVKCRTFWFRKHCDLFLLYLSTPSSFLSSSDPFITQTCCGFWLMLSVTGAAWVEEEADKERWKTKTRESRQTDGTSSQITQTNMCWIRETLNDSLRVLLCYPLACLVLAQCSCLLH